MKLVIPHVAPGEFWPPTKASESRVRNKIRGNIFSSKLWPLLSLSTCWNQSVAVNFRNDPRQVHAIIITERFELTAFMPKNSALITHHFANFPCTLLEKAVQPTSLEFLLT